MTMRALANKHVVLGVTGGIAAYKSADLVRRLRDAGAQVRVVMTESALQFITPLTLQALSGHRVHNRLLDADSEVGMGHIELARWADVVLVAPATASFIARLGNGMADDLLATLCLATTAPIALAPAMNRQMWANPATRANVARLEERGVYIFGPAQGDQACGETGPGRMLEPQQIAAMTAGLFATGRLAGLHVLVTAGPTREGLDPVRCLTNYSSGKMGFAVAAAAVEAGAQVTLVCGPVNLAAPDGVHRIDVRTAQEMYDTVLALAADQDIVIAAASVADYRPRQVRTEKIKKGGQVVQLELEPTPDILGALAGSPRRPFIVGFAAETQDLERNAQYKRINKSLDMIAANWVNRPGSGFEGDENELILFWEGGQKTLPRDTKTKLARELIAALAERFNAKSTTQNP